MVKFVSAEQVLLLRSKVLRDNQPLANCVFPTDQVDGAFHLGCFAEDELVSVASFAPVSYRGKTSPGYQLRGMATADKYKGKGCGSALIEFAVSQLHVTPATHLWCNARVAAAPFYEKHKFEKVSDAFEIEGIGAHFEMILELHKYEND